MSYQIDIHKPMGERITNMTLASSGELIDPAKTYTVAGWASVNEGTEGPPIYDVVSDYVERKKSVNVDNAPKIKVIGG